MARVALAYGGAIIGSFFGPVGQAAGYAIGSYVGGRFFGDEKANQGAEQIDTSIQTGQHGTPLALHYGTSSLAGTLLWVKGNKLDVREREHSVGGKGGGGQSYTTQEVFATFAVEFTFNGPATGVRRIWANRKLIYDFGAGDLAAQIAAGGAVVATSQIPGVTIRIHRGTTTQNPDPAIVAEKGVGMVPGFREKVYIVFEDMPLEAFGRAIPNIEAEIVQGTETALWANFGPQIPFQWDKYVDRNLVNLSTGNVLREYDIRSGEILREVDFASRLSGEVFDAQNVYYLSNNTIVITFAGANSGPIWLLERNSLTKLASIGALGPGGDWLVGSWRVFEFAIGETLLIRWLVGIGFNGGIQVINVTSAATFLNGIAAQVISAGGATGDSWTTPAMRRKGAVYELALSFHTSGAHHLKFFELRPNENASTVTTYPYELLLTDTVDVSSYFPGGKFTVNAGVTYYEDENVYVFKHYDRLFKVDADTKAILATMAGANTAATVQNAWDRGARNGKLDFNGGSPVINILDIATFTVEFSTADIWAGHLGGGGAIGEIYYLEDQAAFLVTNGGFNQNQRLFLPRLDPNKILLRDIISDVSARCNLPAPRIVVSSITQELWGFDMRRVATGRTILEILFGYFFVAAADTDTKLVFKNLGAAPTITIDADELGAGDDAPADNEASIAMIQEAELPAQVDVGYIDIDSDYDIESQPYQRPAEAVHTVEKIAPNFPIVSYADEAAQVAEKIARQAWNERLQPLKIQVPRKYKKIAPLDVISVPYLGTTLAMRVEKISEGQLLELEGPVQDADAFTSAAVGAPSTTPAQSIAAIDDTNLFLIDCNALREEDHNAGFYLAVSCSTGGLFTWSGATAHKSADGIAFDELFSTTRKVVYGVAEDALPYHTETVFDRTNSLTIRLGNGTLSSVSEADVLNLENHALLQSGDGWEIIGFADVTDNGDGTHTLSTLLRGRRGTEVFAGGHLGGDRFILLDAQTMRRYVNASERGLVRYYKAATFGQVFDSVGAQQFTNTARALKPYAPAYVAGARDGSNNLTVTWTRRTWQDGNGGNFGALPLGEDSENYEVDIMNGSTVLRTIAASSETASYSAAEQTADGLTPGDPVEVNVYQLNATVGRGYAANATV